MTITKTIPAWLNIDAMVDADLKRRADELVGRFDRLYVEVVPLCHEAMTVLAEIQETEPKMSEYEHLIGDQDSIADGLGQLFGQLNGSTALFDTLYLLSDAFKIAASHINPADLDNPKEHAE
jgi:hypothetical protein